MELGLGEKVSHRWLVQCGAGAGGEGESSMVSAVWSWGWGEGESSLVSAVWSSGCRSHIVIAWKEVPYVQ